MTNFNQFTTEEILNIIYASYIDVNEFLSTQTESTEKINSKLKGEEVSLTYTEEQIHYRIVNKIAADSLELTNTVKYSGVTPHISDKMEVGAVLSSSWGYDQTNVNFYVIVEMTNTMAKVLPMEAITAQTGFMSGHTCATKNIVFRNEIIKKKVKGDYIKITDCQYARLWDGKKQYNSWYA